MVVLTPYQLRVDAGDAGTFLPKAGAEADMCLSNLRASAFQLLEVISFEVLSLNRFQIFHKAIGYGNRVL